MDNFHEEVVKKKDMTLNNIIYYTSYLFMVIFGLISLNFLFSILAHFNIINLIIAVIAGGIAYGLYVLRNSQKIEYEYTFTNGDIDIAKVIMNSKRVHILSTNAKEFEVIAPVNSDAYKKISHNIRNYKIFKAYNNIDKLYFGIFSQNGKHCFLLFEPSDKLLKLLNLYNPKNVQVE
ncbi:hypothetical protein SAMN02746089_00455 [Caldanaerobius fijiensis DSM 17918]|uniref:Uncharacterized protein n=1 Tax=Caldanaerobius fijiensis DSM 17918 TaxID=1121256 RepID=A0A1M4UEF4_9THEO|nr:DUF6106 family protein [Caldanaerobius fijiensis]SHE55132.1 hypothetical protein SAMN02746089_00455 [Caldanaerobius fijiensis DSM 17918]